MFSFLFARSKNGIQKHVSFNLGVFALICAALELYSYSAIKSLVEESRHARYKGYFIANDILGYGPVKGQTVRIKRYHNQRLIYDVLYTIANNGLRISPPSHDDHCILFFGDSFTFGEGIRDHETMPYVVGELSGYKEYNFGFHGYGPHQMLSAIEHGFVESVVHCEPGYAVYTVLVEHVARAAGYSFWDKHGPKYVLLHEGVKYTGHFDDDQADGDTIGYRARIQAQVEKSYVYKKYFENRYRITDEDVRRFIEIVDASRKKLVKIYPGLQFHVILWPEDTGGAYDRVRTGLLERGIKLHYINEILSDWPIHMSRYILSDYDQHPNAFAQAQIAKYVVSQILSTQVNSGNNGMAYSRGSTTSGHD